MPARELLLAMPCSGRTLGLVELGSGGLVVLVVFPFARDLQLAHEENCSFDGLFHTDALAPTVLKIPHDLQLPPQRRVLGHFLRP